MTDVSAVVVDRAKHIFLWTGFGALNSNSLWLEQFKSLEQAWLSEGTDRLRKQSCIL